MLPIFQKCLTLNVLFQTLRDEFCQIYWKCCDQWGQKSCVFITLTDQIEQRCQSPAFTLTPQTVSALNTTLCAHAMLIDDLLNEACQYMINARLQSDPVEDIFPSSGERMAVGFLSICEKSKIPRGFCNTVLYLKRILTFEKRILHLKIRSALHLKTFSVLEHGKSWKAFQMKTGQK